MTRLVVTLAGIALGLVILVPLMAVLLADWMDYRHDCRTRRRIHAPLV